MNKVEKFIENHGSALIVGGSIVAFGAIVLIFGRAVRKQSKLMTQVTNFDLEGVIKFMQEIPSETKYAIFKETKDQVFQIVQL